MVISHKYKYLFLELPRTGTTGLSAELCKHYDGELIHQKHTIYSKFHKNATDQEKEYFVFSCIRNPIDRTVSLFFHLDKTLESLTIRIRNEKNFIKLLRYKFTYWYFERRYNYINNNKNDFSSYFLKYYKTPYVDWSVFNHKDFDFVIRFEHIQDDFKDLVNQLGMKFNRDLPIINKTKGRDKDYCQYFSDQAIERAKKVFGPFLDKWNYSFPDEWGNYRPNKVNVLIFNIKIILLKIFHSLG